MSRNNRPPVSIQRLVKAANRKNAEGKTLVVVGTITDDRRINEVPAMTVCALRFTQSAQNRIVNAGGKCMTFDELALQAPTGSDTILLRGPLKAREAFKHFAGKPYLPTKHKRYERAVLHGKVKRNKRKLKKQ
jgi:large subunit ribosomal protein L18e